MKTSYIEYLRNMVGHNKVIVNATAIVIPDERDRILLQKRSDNGLWGLPGGLLEMDETIEEGAIREVKEETNLDIVITQFIGVFVNPDMRWRDIDEAKVYSYGFIGKTIGGSLEINDDESTELRYFAKSELPPVHSVDNQDIIDAYYKQKSHLVEGKYYNGNE
jgi:ADP-ribose pyrophosphatase YjhB (NUDIX family)